MIGLIAEQNSQLVRQGLEVTALAAISGEIGINVTELGDGISSDVMKIIGLAN